MQPNILALSLWPGSGFWEVGAILTRLLQLRRLFFLRVHRAEGGGVVVVSAAAAGGDGNDVLGPSTDPRRLAALPVVPLSDQLVVFHQFFQSSIDSGLCISEARVLWRWR